MDEPKLQNPEPIESSPAAAETVEELRKQVEEKQDRLLRALAEAENF
jgi:molecular chaperone GrpE (heat shock protein)